MLRTPIRIRRPRIEVAGSSSKTVQSHYSSQRYENESYDMPYSAAPCLSLQSLIIIRDRSIRSAALKWPIKCPITRHQPAEPPPHRSHLVLRAHTRSVPTHPPTYRPIRHHHSGAVGPSGCGETDASAAKPTTIYLTHRTDGRAVTTGKQ